MCACTRAAGRSCAGRYGVYTLGVTSGIIPTTSTGYDRPGGMAYPARPFPGFTRYPRELAGFTYLVGGYFLPYSRARAGKDIKGLPLA